ncbi:hypothetical protein MTBUT4_300013 [Magnetospirillum sp. UT-4]|nr:hypothetical protein MTBUT4_300013 [Magnetospirillum sp. UT-4]
MPIDRARGGQPLSFRSSSWPAPIGLPAALIGAGQAGGDHHPGEITPVRQGDRSQQAAVAVAAGGLQPDAASRRQQAAGQVGGSPGQRPFGLAAGTVPLFRGVHVHCAHRLSVRRAGMADDEGVAIDNSRDFTDLTVRRCH